MEGKMLVILAVGGFSEQNTLGDVITTDIFL